MVGVIILGICAYCFVGFVLLGAIATTTSLGELHGFPCFNPLWLYGYYTNLNWFGCVMLALGLNLLCPPISICYWFYKLCTVGRK